MTAFVTLDGVSLASPDGQPLFEDLTLALGRERIGVVGRNGSGKSTLLRAIAGEVEPTDGAIHRAGSVRLLRQAMDERLTVEQALGLAAELARLRRLEAGEGSLDDAAQADWGLPGRLEAALAQTGLSAALLDRSIASFSGGERTRIALARLLVEAPDVLLMDEPTNNLDAAGRDIVRRVMETWRGGVLVASHDRTLLDQVDRIVELSPVGVSLFSGSWAAFQEMRDAAGARAQADVERADRALKETEREVQTARERQDRRDKVGRAKRAKGDAPKILLDARAQRAEMTAARTSRLADRLTGERAQALASARARLEVLAPLTIELPNIGLPPARELLAFDRVTMAFDGEPLFGPLSFTVRGPQRIAIRGANGSGKTTLLRLIAGDLAPTTGTIHRLTSRVAMLDQHVGVLDPSETILDNLRRLNPSVSDNKARAVLARFAFRNRAALQNVGTLSGGERMRAGLACVFARPHPPELLLLDEPTNHLDLAAVETLQGALAAFDGALIIVSHDEAFLGAIGGADRIDLSPCDSKTSPVRT